MRLLSKRVAVDGDGVVESVREVSKTDPEAVLAYFRDFGSGAGSAEGLFVSSLCRIGPVASGLK